MRIGTKVIRAGLAPAAQGESFLAGVTFAGTYHASGETSASPYTYGRYHNPTWTQFERALNELEGGIALSFASGMAAVAAVFGITLRAGDVLVMPSDCYYTARLLADGFFAEIGVQVRKAPTAGGGLSQLLTGHSDLILGHVAVRDAARAEKLLSWRTQIGAVPGPMEVWLAHRSLATLEMRLERQCRNALTIAEYLATRSDVTELRYPGLPHDPSHEIAVQQMRYYGSVVGFVLADRARAEQFLKSCKLIIEATSFGGVHTTAERRARWGGDEIPEGFIRLSAGCEDSQDLVDDVAQALDEI